MVLQRSIGRASSLGVEGFTSKRYGVWIRSALFCTGLAG
jgi:hypothetical protein